MTSAPRPNAAPQTPAGTARTLAVMALCVALALAIASFSVATQV